MNKILSTILDVLKFIGGLPEFVLNLLPFDLKGWRTIVINFIAALLTILEGLDFVGLFEGICNVVELFGGNCDPTGAAAVWASIITFINMVLRAITDTPVGEPSNGN